jgi:hypothetical protein
LPVVLLLQRLVRPCICFLWLWCHSLCGICLLRGELQIGSSLGGYSWGGCEYFGLGLIGEVSGFGLVEVASRQFFRGLWGESKSSRSPPHDVVWMGETRVIYLRLEEVLSDRLG